MKTQINMSWMQETLKGDNTKNQQNKENQQGSKYDWVLNGKAFKKDLKFKIIPANSKENGIFCHTVATHWLDVNGERKRFVCPEQTNHLKNLGVKCPICEAKRQLLAMGFKEEDLTQPGKFGPIPVFDPKLTSNLKVVVISSDLKNDWDQNHISILQQNGSFLTQWMVKKYVDEETPDLLNWEHSNLVRFSRQSDNSKFEREISFAAYDPSVEMLAKLKEENENLTLPELWKLPNDEEMLAFRQVAEDLKKKYVEARNIINQAYSDPNPQPVPAAQPAQVQSQPQPQQGVQSQSFNATPSWNSPSGSTYTSDQTQGNSDYIPF